MFTVGQTILDVYVVERVLGIGGAGEVFLVRRKLDDRRYAVKTIHSRKIDSTRFRQDLLREIRVSQNLTAHPHIVPTRFFRMIDGNMILFLEYIDGGSLRSWIKNHKLKLHEDVLDIAIQMLWGLDAIHSGKIIHKDIKPANVMMEQNGTARIADFGLIRGMTIAFCSPEQMSDERLTSASDLWSWALVVMTMWMGKRPWRIGGQAGEAIHLLADDDNLFGKAPGRLIDILRHCLQFEPELRPESAFQIAEKLKQVYRETTGDDYPRPDPPEIDPGPSTQTAGRSSMVDGIEIHDPKQYLAAITDLLKIENINIASLIPEVTNPPETFIDDLQAYMFLETLLRKVSSEGNPRLLYELCRVIRQKAWILFDTGDPKGSIAAHATAIELLMELIKGHDKQDFWHGVASNYADIAFVYNHIGEYRLASTNILKAREALEKFPEKFRTPTYYYDVHNILSTQGIVASQLGNTDNALEVFIDARTILDKIPDLPDPEMNTKVTAAKAQSEYNIGTFLDGQEQFKEAIEHYRYALAFQKQNSQKDKVNEQVFLASICMNIGICFAQMKKIQQAESFFTQAGQLFKRALTLSSHHYIQRKYAHFLTNQANFMYDIDRINDAIMLLEESVENYFKIFEAHGSVEYKSLLVKACIDLRNCYRETGQSEKEKTVQNMIYKVEQTT